MTTARALATLTCLALCLACSSAPRGLTTRLEAPARPAIELEVRDDPRGPTWSLVTDPSRIDGGHMRWLGAFGEVLQTHPLDRDTTWPLTDRAPAFARSWQVALRLAPVGPVPRCLVAGGPLLPRLAPGPGHLVYLVEVVAPDLTRALELAGPIDEGLTDAPPRPAVDVLLHLTARFESGVGLVLCASGTTLPRGARARVDGAPLVADSGAPIGWQAHQLHGWGRLEASVPLMELTSDAPRRSLVLETGTSPLDLARATIELGLGDEP